MIEKLGDKLDPSMSVSYTHLTVAHYMRIRAPNAAVLAPMTDIRK